MAALVLLYLQYGVGVAIGLGVLLGIVQYVVNLGLETFLDANLRRVIEEHELDSFGVRCARGVQRWLQKPWHWVLNLFRYRIFVGAFGFCAGMALIAWFIPRVVEVVPAPYPVFSGFTQEQLNQQTKPLEDHIIALNRDLEIERRDARNNANNLIALQRSVAATINLDQRIDFENALRYRIKAGSTTEGVVVRIYAEQADSRKARSVVEMIYAAGWKTARDATDSPVLRPTSNILPGLTIRQPANKQNLPAWVALRQSLSAAHIGYTDGGAADDAEVRIEVGQ